SYGASTDVANAASAKVLATPAQGAITLDGALDEADWSHAPTIDLTQQDPHPGEPTPYRTQIRLLTDRNHLYLGITCVDPDFGKRSVHTLERDSDQTGDDHLMIVLDTFGNHRVGYVFQVNAGGARTDGLISPASPDPSFDWDGIWDAKVQRTAEGWSAEIAIDTRDLQFRNGVDRWGLNVQRYVPRDQLSLQWANITLNTSIFDLARMGVLEGVGAFDQGRGLEVSPYALGRHDSLGNRNSVQVGGDVRYNFTPELTAIVTVNPDFAEAEADAQQINLTRFSLFFPEKRRFFLEGSNQFTFGAGLTNTDNVAGVFIPFYSRSIGLVNGQTVRLDEGVKVIGQTGSWAIGMLDVETGRSAFGGPTNLFAGHLTYDVDEHLRVGAMLTRGDPTGTGNNAFTGLDAVWHTASFRGNKNLTLAGWAGRTEDDVHTGQHSGWGLSAQYPNDLWNVNTSVNVFGDALDPALGYLPRPGTRQYDVYLDYRPRPTSPALRWARQFFYQLEVQQVDDLHGNTQTRQIFTAPFNVDTESGAHFEFDWIPDYEALAEPFEIVPGVTLPVGQYHFDRYRFETQSSDARPLRIGNVLEIGSFYHGRLIQTKPFVNWTTLAGKLRFELSDETDFGYLPQGNFIQRLYQLKASYSFSPDLELSSFVQYDSTIGHVGLNMRLHWILAPGRDFFLVLNHGVEASITDPNAPLTAISNVVVAKLRWDFRP
ncbi:MAG TPA: DUF5916 domain-containing protein, partial [Xanthomonadaceae bacterium]|nr:DUF5916 domain-containing protein [Xanthomonadaceae bacterium]